MTALPDFSAAVDQASIPYAATARVPARPAAKVWAAVATLFAALGLVGLAGAFLIGVMTVVDPTAFYGTPLPPPQQLTGPQSLLVGVLYAMTALCVAGASAVGFVAVKWLRSIVKQ